MSLFSVILSFSSLQTASTITSERIIQPDDLKFTQLIATQHDCSKQYNLRQFNLIRVKNCIRLPLNADEHLLLSLFVLKRKQLKVLTALQLLKGFVYFVRKVNMRETEKKKFLDWQTNSMPLPEQLDPNECKKFNRSLNGTEGAELNQYS